MMIVCRHSVSCSLCWVMQLELAAFVRLNESAMIWLWVLFCSVGNLEIIVAELCVCVWCVFERERGAQRGLTVLNLETLLNIYLSLQSSFQVDLQVVVTVGGPGVEEDGEKRTKQDKTGELMKEYRGREEDTEEVIILTPVLVLIRTSTMEVL